MVEREELGAAAGIPNKVEPTDLRRGLTLGGRDTATWGAGGLGASTACAALPLSASGVAFALGGGGVGGRETTGAAAGFVCATFLGGADGLAETVGRAGTDGFAAAETLGGGGVGGSGAPPFAVGATGGGGTDFLGGAGGAGGTESGLAALEGAGGRGRVLLLGGAGFFFVTFEEPSLFAALGAFDARGGGGFLPAARVGGGRLEAFFFVDVFVEALSLSAIGSSYQSFRSAEASAQSGATIAFSAIRPTQSVVKLTSATVQARP